MEPALGWTLLSRDALKRAETQLRDDTEGVLDEVGFLGLHTAYADRFFPGTSVLLTRLRYALFVPWLYQALEKGTQDGQTSAAIRAAELRLVPRLKKSGEQGIIGSRSYPKPTSQPPSMTYWNALGQWRLLRPLGSGEAPGRAVVHRHLDRRRAVSRLTNDDQEPLLEEQPLFVTMPAPPKNWNDGATALTFEMPGDERAFMRRHLAATRRADGAPTLLAALADARVLLDKEQPMVSDEVLSVADPADQAALERSRGLASLSAIGRAVYAALVETVRDEDDGLSTPSANRDALPGVLDEHREASLAVELDGVTRDAPRLAGNPILLVLRETQSWLESPRDVRALQSVYTQAEERRKGRRARLPGTGVARKQRGEWSAEEHPAALPLAYRWANVRRLLRDLENE